MNDSELALLDLVATPLFVLDASSDGELSYLFFNKAALDIAKFNLEDYLGLNAKNLYHSEYGEFAFQKHTECYLSAQAVTYILPLPLDGKLRSIRTHLTPRLNDSGQVTHIIGTSTEVTVEQDLNDIREESRGIEKELQEFFYLAAHDLRSPMKRIHMLADLLREDFQDLGDGKLEIINMLEKIAVESMSMIQRVLQHAETTGIEESVEDFSLPVLIDNILATLDPNKAHQYRIDDCSIIANKALIQAVLRNLVDNALNHNQPNTISLDVKAVNSKSGYFTLTVSDNGKGMDAPEKLFSNTDTDRSKSGFGLLAIRTLIKKAGGDIFAKKPDDGPGLAVTVMLPGNVSQLRV